MKRKQLTVEQRINLAAEQARQSERIRQQDWLCAHRIRVLEEMDNTEEQLAKLSREIAWASARAKEAKL